MKNTINLADRRCSRTREALEQSLFQFFTVHPYSEKLSVVTLCKSAGVSTPTFYRHYPGLLEVAEAGHMRIQMELTVVFEENTSLLISLTRLFYFVAKHALYYRYSVLRMNARAFEGISSSIQTEIKLFVRTSRGTRRAKMVDDWICFEVGNYVATVLKWWILWDKLDIRKIDDRVQEILAFIKQRIEASEKRLAAGMER
ncbi:TetR/AcrR family transcriptional regulator [Candidatus Saccharibacteria bacterium]|nr:TetR/AcrR family transcriptional regulator [Candidatus Saccharibacteria bacterium]